MLKQRRFIISEGLFRNSGDLCPLPELLAFKKKYKFRIILDESLSFGTLGRTGRGITEHYGVKISEIDMVTVAMDCTLGSVGGGCVGTREVVDHQRLSGSGYCFSASAPPFLFAAAVDSLEHLQAEGAAKLLPAMRANLAAVVAGLKAVPQLALTSSDESPVVHLALATPAGDFDSELVVIQALARECLQRGVAVVASTYDVKLMAELKSTCRSLRATLRLNVSAALSAADIKHLIKEIREAAAAVIKTSK